MLRRLTSTVHSTLTCQTKTLCDSKKNFESSKQNHINLAHFQTTIRDEQQLKLVRKTLTHAIHSKSALLNHFLCGVDVPEASQLQDLDLA